MKKIEVLGTGCPKCEQLLEMVRKAVDETGSEFDIVKVSDLSDIMEYGVMLTPALVINGEIKVSGKLPDLDSLKQMLV